MFGTTDFADYTDLDNETFLCHRIARQNENISHSGFGGHGVVKVQKLFFSSANSVFSAVTKRFFR